MSEEFRKQALGGGGGGSFYSPHRIRGGILESFKK
jgi:hypothetical protein